MANGSLRALRRPGRRLPAVLRARRRSRRSSAIPTARRTPTPEAHRLHARASCSAASRASSGLREFLEGRGHRLIVTSDKDGPGLRLRARAARRRGRHLPALLARLPDRRADRQGAEPEAGDHRRHRLRPRRPAGGDRRAGITVAEVTYSNSISVAEHVVMMILALVRNYIPSYQWVRRRRLEHRRLRRALLRPRGHAGRARVAAGRIGSAVLRRLKPFDVGLHYTDRHRLPPRGRGGARRHLPPRRRVAGRRSATWSRSTRRCTRRPRTSSTTRCSAG